MLSSLAGRSRSSSNSTSTQTQSRAHISRLMEAAAHSFLTHNPRFYSDRVLLEDARSCRSAKILTTLEPATAFRLAAHVVDAPLYPLGVNSLRGARQFASNRAMLHRMSAALVRQVCPHGLLGSFITWFCSKYNFYNMT